MRKHLLLAALLLLLPLSYVAEVRAALPYSVTFRNFFKAGSDSLTFARPVTFVPYPGVDSAYIVLQQGGKIMTVRRVNNAWAKTDSASVTVNGGTTSGGEQGLLGFAFHPNFSVNRKYYIYFIAAGSTQGGFDMLAERIADSTLRPKTGDAQRTLLRITDPYNNHNGGTIAFGQDGYLYLGIGDGGNGGDPQGRAQNLDSLLGKILRFDVDGADAFPSDTTRNYAIPSDNPFVGVGTAKPEIWAYGLRNPWKWSFHPTNGQLWVGDVGQDYVEEVSRVPKGGNMGWKVREGNTCFNSLSTSSPLASCTTTGMTPAVIGVLQPKAQSMTGGVFFVGNPASAFNEVYFFGDYATDSIWAARIVNDSAVERIRLGAINTVSSFNLDRQGRVFALNVDNGIVNILESPDMIPATVSLRTAKRTGMRPLRAGELLRNPEAFELRGLDGRVLHTPAVRTGVTWVRKKGGAEPAQLVVVP